MSNEDRRKSEEEEERFVSSSEVGEGGLRKAGRGDVSSAAFVPSRPPLWGKQGEEVDETGWGIEVGGFTRGSPGVGCSVIPRLICSAHSRDWLD